MSSLDPIFGSVPELLDRCAEREADSRGIVDISKAMPVTLPTHVSLDVFLYVQM